MPDVDTEGLLRDSERQLMASAKVSYRRSQSVSDLCFPRQRKLTAARCPQTDEERSEARDIIAKVHEPSVAADAPEATAVSKNGEGAHRRAN